MKYFSAGFFSLALVLVLTGLAVHAAESTFSVGFTVLPEDLTATIQWVVPEKRSGPAETNDDLSFYLKVKDSTGATTLFTSTTTASTSPNGTYATPLTLPGVVNGTYDVSIKTHQHLSAKLDDVVLASGNNVLNFTQADNSAPKGSLVLKAGDISGVWSTNPATLGDNVINSVDLSILLNNLDDVDSSGNDIRANLNQDTAVNSVDLSLLLNNLDEQGEE